VLAATHRDLRERVARGQFREDLFYRLNVVQLRVPPLRERREDVPVLARHFLERFCERFGTGPLRLPGGLWERLSAWHWPGNVRELENAMESLVALSPEGALDLSLLPTPASAGAAEAPVPAGATLRQRVEAYERGLVLQALSAAHGNRSEAARQLGISRVTLHDKLKKYGVGPAADDPPAEEPSA
jgi:DNA-binding NtrC family response regulator